MSFDINELNEKSFKELPLVIEGESKEVRYFGNGLVAIRFKPTIYSFTANRCAVVPGSDKLRLRASKVFTQVLSKAGIKHAYRQIGENFVLADLVMPHIVEFRKYGLDRFMPVDDLKLSQIYRLAKGPPIEIIVKRFHGGTSKHRYLGMDNICVRDSHPLYAGMMIKKEDAYPCPIVRFDWRNPIRSLGHVNNLGDDRVADEILPEDLADSLIDVKKAKQTAMRVYNVLENFLSDCDIVCNDLCLFIAEDGETVYGEISQDCGRFRHFDLGSLDKDVWRSGGSAEDVLKKWEMFASIIEKQNGGQK